MNNVNLSAPWVTFYREIGALLGDDPEITLSLDDANNNIKVYVDNPDKAEALQALLPSERTFGNVTVTITIIPANNLAESRASLFRRAFEGNPAFAYEQSSEKGLYSFSYIVFKNKVVQFFNDNLQDVNGNCSTLYQEIAKNVFGEQEGIFFCTDTEEKVGKDQE